MRRGNTVSSRRKNYAKPRGRKMDVGKVSEREQIGEEQVEKLGKLGGGVCKYNGYITVPRDCA